MWRNFLLTGIIFLLSGAILYVTIKNLDPLGEQQVVVFSAFFAAIFFGIASFFTFIFFFAAELVKGKKLNSRYFSVAVRRALLVSIFVSICFFLQIFRFLGLLEAILLACFLASLEWVFMGAKGDKSTLENHPK